MGLSASPYPCHPRCGHVIEDFDPYHEFDVAGANAADWWTLIGHTIDWLQMLLNDPEATEQELDDAVAQLTTAADHVAVATLQPSLF